MLTRWRHNSDTASGMMQHGARHRTEADSLNPLTLMRADYDKIDIFARSSLEQSAFAISPARNQSHRELLRWNYFCGAVDEFLLGVLLFAGQLDVGHSEREIADHPELGDQPQSGICGRREIVANEYFQTRFAAYPG